jgi:hypothetical protein
LLEQERGRAGRRRDVHRDPVAEAQRRVDRQPGGRAGQHGGRGVHEDQRLARRVARAALQRGVQQPGLRAGAEAQARAAGRVVAVAAEQRGAGREQRAAHQVQPVAAVHGGAVGRAVAVAANQGAVLHRDLRAAGPDRVGRDRIPHEDRHHAHAHDDAVDDHEVGAVLRDDRALLVPLGVGDRGVLDPDRAQVVGQHPLADHRVDAAEDERLVRGEVGHGDAPELQVHARASLGREQQALAVDEQRPLVDAVPDQQRVAVGRRGDGRVHGGEIHAHAAVVVDDVHRALGARDAAEQQDAEQRCRE